MTTVSLSLVNRELNTLVKAGYTKQEAQEMLSHGAVIPSTMSESYVDDYGRLSYPDRKMRNHVLTRIKGQIV